MTREYLFQRHEREVAELLGASVTVGSGASWEKLDVRQVETGSRWRMMVECKCTSALGYRVTDELWRAVRELAYGCSENARPGLAIRLYGEDTGPGTEIRADLITMSVHDVAELLAERDRLAVELEALKSVR